MLIAILVDLPSCHIFENKIGLPLACNSSINQLRDVRMRKLAENPAFTLEPLSRSLRGNGEIQKLDRHLPLEAAIDTFGQPHLAHSAIADARDQLVCTEGFTC